MEQVNKEKETNIQKGKRGEDVAASYLEQKGYKIIQRNFRSGSLEVDIIAENKEWLVFVEVKLRYSENHGGPWEAVNQKKRRHIIMAADNYIRRNQPDKEVRFDIISIVDRNGKSEVEHIEDAFYPQA